MNLFIAVVTFFRYKLPRLIAPWFDRSVYVSSDVTKRYRHQRIK